MTEQERTPLDSALDLLVYAPLGLALSAREALPKLAEKGRQQLTARVGVARMIGQFATQQGGVEADKAIRRARRQAQTTLEQLGFLDPEAPPPSSSSSPPRTPPAPPPTPPTTPPRPQPAAPSAGPADALAIPDYESLSASQVVPRLGGLAPEELEAVRAYEAGHRSRRTILAKVDQLQAGARPS